MGYEYRIARTEVTNGQWLEFVRAYEPYYTGSRIASSFTGNSIVPVSLDPGQPAQFTMDAGATAYAVTASWE